MRSTSVEVLILERFDTKGLEESHVELVKETEEEKILLQLLLYVYEYFFCGETPSKN